MSSEVAPIGGEQPPVDPESAPQTAEGSASDAVDVWYGREGGIATINGATGGVAFSAPLDGWVSKPFEPAPGTLIEGY